MDYRGKLDLVKTKWWWFAISGLVIIPGLISLIFSGLKLGIDFTGGSLIQLKFNQAVTIDGVRQVLTSHNLGGSHIQLSEGNTVLIRTKALNTQDEQTALISDLQAKLGPFDPDSKRVELVGPVMGKELLFNSLIALGLALAAIVAYITIRFKFDFAICAIIALIHDLVVIVGIFSILGFLFHTEIDTLFITALLTVIGFSVHNTIVTFDRIRENNQIYGRQESFDSVVNRSLWQTMERNINTSLTVVLTLVALYVLGGSTIHDFTLALIIGIVSGTYSAVLNASPLLALFREWQEKRSKTMTDQTAA